MDAGQYEAGESFEAGAQMTTVLGVSDLATIADCIKCAGQDHEVFVDLICVQDLPKRVDQLRQIGATPLRVHVGVDQQAFGLTTLAALQELKTLGPDMTISVAGGIHETPIQDYIQLKPDIVSVGSGITHAPDPQKTAHALAQAIRNGDCTWRKQMPNHTSCFHDVLSVQTILDSILEELETMTQAIDPSQLEQALSCLQNVFDEHKIFLAGAGRSGLVASLFANRLVHLGFRVNRVDEITAGPISKDDLLIVISGSGKTTSLLAMVENAKFAGAHLLLITLNLASPMAQEASCIVLPGSTSWIKTMTSNRSSRSVLALSNWPFWFVRRLSVL